MRWKQSTHQEREKKNTLLGTTVKGEVEMELVSFVLLRETIAFLWLV